MFITVVLLSFSLMYFGFCYYVISKSIIPVRLSYESTPIEAGLKAECISFNSAWDGIPLVGWLIPSSGNRAIVMVHGLDGNAWSGAGPIIAQAYVNRGFNVLVFDLRGRGKSGGNRIGFGWDERGDVRAAVDILLDRGIEPGEIGLHGTSYGAATSLLAAAEIPEVGAVIADSSFSDMRDMMDAEIEKRSGVSERISRLMLRPGIKLLARAMYSIDFDEIAPERAINKIYPRPIFLIHGEKDPEIPVSHVYRLSDASTKATTDVWILSGVGHTEGIYVWSTPQEISPYKEEYLKRVIEFFENNL